MFDAVIFDLDGTLVDTERLAVETGTAALQQMGHQVDAGFLHRLVGKDRQTGGRIIAKAFPAIDVDAFDALWRTSFDAQVAQGLPLKPFALDLLQAIRLPLALVTSSHRAECALKLSVTGLGRFFPVIVTFEDVTAPKPHPEPYLRAAGLLQVAPARCVVFEDSETGAEAAHRAGMTVVQVPDVLPTDGRFAHHVAQDLLSGARRAGLQI